MTRRKPELSMLNVLFCLTIVFVNSIAYAVSALKPGTIPYTLTVVPWRLGDFAVQGFVMLSGILMFLSGRDKVAYPKYLAKRIFEMVLPYTICFVVYYVFFAVAHNYPLDPLFIAKSYFLGSLAPGIYLVPLMFQFDLLAPLWKKLVNKCSPIVILPLALLLSPGCTNYIPQIINSIFPDFSFAYNDRLFTSYLSYWLIGCCIGKSYDKFCDLTKNHFTSIAVIYGILTTLNIVLNCLTYHSIAFVPYLSNIHNMYVIYTCVFFFSIFLKLADTGISKNPVVSWLDDTSLYFWLYHMLLILIIQRLVAMFV